MPSDLMDSVLPDQQEVQTPTAALMDQPEPLPTPFSQPTP